MSEGRVCEGTGRFLHCIKEGGTRGKHGFTRGSELASDAHEYRILGLMKAYDTSTTRFTRTKMMAMKRIPPWSTG